MTEAASIANDRFGLGATPYVRAPGDVRGWLADQLTRFDPMTRELTGSLFIEELVSDYAATQERVRTVRRGDAMAGEEDSVRDIRRDQRQQDQQTLFGAMNERLHLAAVSDTPFAERLVHFWANHFAVSHDKIGVRSLAADYEFAAIRPNIMGNFADLLRAAIGHPAMLLFLDQAGSLGPNSSLALRVNRRRRQRQLGLNENLAREILELHTLGVRSGYSQDDVVELARALTGWTVSGFVGRRLGRSNTVAAGEVLFAEQFHEPGARTLLGRRYAEGGAEQALAMLQDIAEHPATARHIAFKLARHFVADDPPESAIARLERAFLDSGGDLPAVYAALIASPEIWEAQRNKFRTPWEWSVAALRAMDAETLPGNQRAANTMLEALGQPIWRPGNPSGWSDVVTDWASPGALMTRVEVANNLAARGLGDFDPRSQAGDVLGEALRPSTAQAIARAEEPAMGLALLISSPEFMRR